MSDMSDALNCKTSVDPIRIGMVTILVSFICSILIGCDRNEMQTGNSNPEDAVVKVQILDKSFGIPVRYFYAEAIEKHGRWMVPKSDVVRVGAVNLSVLLPDLRPYHPDDRAQWEEQGHGDRLELSIAAFPGTSREWVIGLRDRDRQKQDPRSGSSIIRGLEHLARPTSDIYFPIDIDPPLFIECDRVASGVKFPSCRVRSVLEPGLELSYSFGIAHIEQWRAIDEGLRALVNRLDVNLK